MSATIAPFPKHVFLDDNGDPAVGFLLFTYESGTTTKLDTFTDAGMSASNTNPIVLDASGRATIFLSAASYKFVLAPADDTDPPASPLWTVDGVQAVSPFTVFSDITGVAGEALSARDAIYLANGTEGGSSTTAGRWYKGDGNATETSNNAISVGFVLADAIAGAAITIRVVGRLEGFSALTIGATYYMSDTAGEIDSTAGSNIRAMGQADTATSLVILYGIVGYDP